LIRVQLSLTQVKVIAEIPKTASGQIAIEKRKDGEYKRKPFPVFYNVFVDGQLMARISRHYGLIDGKLLIKGAIESAEKDLLARYASQEVMKRAIAELDASQFKREATLEI